MADGQILGVAALVVSLLALIISAAFGARQMALMRNANYVPVLIDLLGQFRSLEFNDNYRYICTRLPVEHDPASGISGLPDDVRVKIYDVAYYYQLFAALAATERESAQHTGPFLFRNLEEFARKAQEMPAATVDRFMRGDPDSRSLLIPSWLRR